MRIGMILDGTFPPDPRVENEARVLIDSGFEVHLCNIAFSLGSPSREVVNGIKVSRIDAGYIIRKFSALAYTVPIYHLLLIKKIKRFIREENIDILHIHDIQISRAVFWANRKFGLPVVQDLHENRPEIMKFYRHVRKLSGKLLIYPSRWKKMEGKIIGKSDNVITVTESAKQQYASTLKIPDNKFVVVPNTVRKSFYTKYELENEITDKYNDTFALLYLGETGFRRGIMTVLKSVHLLKGTIPELKIIIVGKSRDDVMYKRYVAREAIGEYVDFEGWQPPSKFQSYIRASKIGLSPLHKNLHHETTYANKLFMYMSLGLPIVVSNCEAQARIVEEYKCGSVFKDRDVKDFANKILNLYKQHEEYEELSNNARQAIANHLSWEIQSVALIKLYQEYEQRIQQ